MSARRPTARTEGSPRSEWLARVILPHETWLRACLRRKYPALEIEDVVQSAYVRLLQSDRTDHVQNPRSYLYQVALSEIVQQARRRHLVTFECLSDDELDIASDDPAIESVVDAKQLLAKVSETMSHLTPLSRTVVELRRVQGLSLRATAEAIGLSASSVEKIQSKALRALKACA